MTQTGPARSVLFCAGAFAVILVFTTLYQLHDKKGSRP